MVAPITKIKKDLGRYKDILYTFGIVNNSADTKTDTQPFSKNIGDSITYGATTIRVSEHLTNFGLRNKLGSPDQFLLIGLSVGFDETASVDDIKKIRNAVVIKEFEIGGTILLKDFPLRALPIFNSLTGAVSVSTTATATTEKMSLFGVGYGVNSIYDLRLPALPEAGTPNPLSFWLIDNEEEWRITLDRGTETIFVPTNPVMVFFNFHGELRRKR